MTDLEVVEINVEVSDIKTRAQFEADSVSLQDRVSDATQSVADFTGSQVKKTSRGIEELTAKEPRVI